MDQRLLPVRCFSCNKLLQRGWDALQREARAGVRPDVALDAAGYLRVCCRRMLLTQPIPLQAAMEPEAESPAPLPPPEAAALKRETTTPSTAKAARPPRQRGTSCS
jgi:DNA-directed RNA polymerase subunit N (RpoN/RPB10)